MFGECFFFYCLSKAFTIQALHESTDRKLIVHFHCRLMREMDCVRKRVRLSSSSQVLAHSFLHYRKTWFYQLLRNLGLSIDINTQSKSFRSPALSSSWTRANLFLAIENALALNTKTFQPVPVVTVAKHRRETRCYHDVLINALTSNYLNTRKLQKNKQT